MARWKWLCWGVAGLCLVQLHAQEAPRPMMSPAGQEAAKAVQEELRSELHALFQKQSETRRQIESNLQVDRPDWPRLRSLLEQDDSNQLEMRRITAVLQHRTMERLSASDRVIYLRDRFGVGLKPPLLIIPPSPAPACDEPAKQAYPRGSAGSWVTLNDYPPSALVSRSEGVAAYRLVVGTDGRVADCTITSSSGFAELDSQACLMLRRRARFVPARNTCGEAVRGAYSSEVRWTIPD